MKAASIQFEFITDESWNDRLSRMSALVQAQRGADLVVLPELWPNGGFTYDNWRATSQPMSGELVEWMRATASAVGCLLHAGSFVESHDDESLTNTSLLLDRDGATLAVYRKVHLFGFGEGEPVLMSAGDEVTTVKTEWGTIGLSTCYDLRFPELYRKLTDAGAELVLVPAAWPAARVEHWTVLARARAIENQCFVVAVNTAGTHGGKLMGGHSLVVDPTGTVLAEAGVAEQSLTAELDLAKVGRWRADFPVLDDRRL